MSSAPEPTEASTTRSPRSAKMRWPERTGSVTRRLGTGSGSGALGGGGAGRRWRRRGRAAALDRRVAAVLESDEAGAEGGGALLGRGVLDADGGEPPGAELARELDEGRLVVEADGLPDVEDERGVDEEVRRLAHQRVEGVEEGLVGRARQPQHDGGERAAPHLERLDRRGDGGFLRRIG